ncbi:MAG: calcium/proton exchanger [Chloroflexota bacterium]|nr:calcium/proton exchanger [Chloroflexota bacterium]
MREKILGVMLIFVPIAIAAELLHWSPTVVFFASAAAVIPLAGFMGEATEVLAEKVGPRLGGLLNATFGNMAELIITIIAIRAGQLALVKASLIGSIMGNILLVLGLAILAGGLKNGVQSFDRRAAGLDATMLILAAIALSVPSIFNHAIEPDFWGAEKLSLATAVVMIGIYALSIIYLLRSRTPEEHYAGPSVQPSHTAPKWSTGIAVAILTASVVGIAAMSEFLLGSIEPVTHALGLSPFFVGIIIIPLIGNVAEHTVAVQVAIRDDMDLSLSIANGSSLQIALFVAPVLVFISLLMGNPMALEFNNFEVIALIASSMIAAVIALDGRSNWLEGSMLLAVYLILAIGFFFLPNSVF